MLLKEVKVKKDSKEEILLFEKLEFKNNISILFGGNG